MSKEIWTIDRAGDLYMVTSPDFVLIMGKGSLFRLALALLRSVGGVGPLPDGQGCAVEVETLLFFAYGESSGS